MNKHRSNYPGSRLWMALTLALMCSARPAPAATNTVTNVNDSGPGSIRQAILNANTGSLPAVIRFNIPPGGPQTITPLSPLPDITTLVTLDATTQPGFSDVPLIELNGTSAGPAANGLTLQGGGQMRGLVINRFSGNGVYAFGAGPSVTILEGNYIGTDATGMLPRGNAQAGIFIFGPGSRIGGMTAASRNVISGNGADGIVLAGMGHTVLGNFIGVGASGNNALGNSQNGVNPVSGPGPHSVGNGTPAGANVIAYNGASGVAVLAGRCAIQGNSLYANNELGIDLSANGVTANDVGDANGLQNFPVLTAATNSLIDLIVHGALNSRTNRPYRIDFYSNLECDPSGHGEGRTHLGFTNVMTGGTANASFRAVFMPLAGGRYLSATATDTNGNTSEFSLCLDAFRPRTNTVTTTAGSGPGSLSDTIEMSNPGDTINFAVTGTIDAFTNGSFTIARDLTFVGPGATNLSISGTNGVTVFVINEGTTVDISGLTIRDGGKGIYNRGTLSLTGCTISGNKSYEYDRPSGGGIFNAISGNLTLTACTIAHNTLIGRIGFFNISVGGGIYNAGTLTATACTIADNTATQPFGADAGPREGVGGGIYNEGGLVTLQACTVSGNKARVGGGGIFGDCTLRNTLVAGNDYPCGPDIIGSVTSFGHNLIGVGVGSTGITNGVNGDLAGTSASPLAARLGGLGDYGGPTMTVPLLFGSLAVDAGDDALLNAPFNLATDQRGRPRKVGAHVDIGAFESAFVSRPGDFNNDGEVDLNELDTVLAGYFSTSPWLAITNVAGLGGAQVTFALTNSLAGAFQVEFSTDLVNWQILGPATPRYEFNDTNAPAIPHRYYRLRLP